MRSKLLLNRLNILCTVALNHKLSGCKEPLRLHQVISVVRPNRVGMELATSVRL